jgi:predicted AAA+ superfamily ATPase
LARLRREEVLIAPGDGSGTGYSLRHRVLAPGLGTHSRTGYSLQDRVLTLVPGTHAITRTPKFYLFDTGVAGIITKRNILEERGEIFGKAFEHFILTEIVAFRSYLNLDFEIGYWRTKTGLEVDFILGDGEIAIEVKGTTRVDSKDLTGIRAFHEELKPRKSIVVCNEPSQRISGEIRIMPFREFLRDLWEREIIF